MVSPGIPDFYQGSELWDFTLVDPDNRRPVDYDSRMGALASLKGREAEIGPEALFSQLQATSEDGRIKLYLIFRVLNYRREHRELFQTGDYLPIEAQGPQSRHLCAFARSLGDKTVIVVAPRLVARLVPEAESAPLGVRAWTETVLPLPQGAGTRFRNVVNGSDLDALERGGEPVIPLAKLFAEVPVALLESVG